MTRRLLLMISILLIMSGLRAPLAAAQDDTGSIGPSNTDCEPASSRETIRGELTELEELEVEEANETGDDQEASEAPTGDDQEASEAPTGDDGEPIEPPDQHRAIITIDEEDQREFLVIGKGDKLELGTDYVVTLAEFDGGDRFEDRVAYLGENLPCASNSTILLLGDNGITEEIDVSGFDLPSVPVTPRQVLLAFGGLAVVAFIFREPRINH